MAHQHISRHLFFASKNQYPGTHQQFLGEFHQVFGLIGQAVHVTGPPVRYWGGRHEHGQLGQ